MGGILFLALSACGGGGGGESPGTPTVPAVKSGEIDASYGTGGYVQLAASEGFREMAVARDGSVYITGNSILKIGPAGSVALEYGQAGRVAMSAVSPLVVDGSGSLLVISGLDVVRLDPSGRLDPAFGNAGRTTLVGVASYLRLDRLARDSQGNVYVAGAAGIAAQTVVTKLGPDGRIDPSFGMAGSSVTPVGATSRVESLAIEDNANIAMAVSLAFTGAGSPARIQIAKIDRNGAPVTGFGNAGVWSPPFTCSSWYVRALAPMPPADLVWGGSCAGSTPGLPILKAMTQKLDPTGAAVSSFQEGGFTLFGPTTPGGLVVESQWVSALLPHASGLYAAGYRRGGLICQQGAVAKLDANGRAAADFGVGGGYVAFDGINDVPSMGLDAAGRLYLGGTHFTACTDTDRPFVVYRLGG